MIRDVSIRGTPEAIEKAKEVIKEMVRTGTTIHIAKEGDAKHPDLRNVIITGDPKNVLEAKRQVLLIADVPFRLLLHF